MQQVSGHFTAILLNSETAIKIEAQTKNIEPEYQGNALADFHVKKAATEFTDIFAHVGEIHLFLQKITPIARLCHPDVLVT